jgi:LacI family transcriptional regulator
MGLCSFAHHAEGYLTREVIGWRGRHLYTMRDVARCQTALDYHPNEVARSLKVNRTSTIDPVVPDVANFFSMTCFRELKKAREKGFLVVLCDSHDDPVQEQELLAMLSRRRLDGILLASAQSNLGEDRLARRRPPIACFERDPTGFKVGLVVIDKVLASFEAARHLIELGHQRIAVIAGPQNTLTGSGRLEGVRKALQEAHVPLREEYVRYSSWSTEDGYQAALQILRLPTLTTAVVGSNNRLTQGPMRALKNLGLKCFQELSVLGFDEFDCYEFYNPLLMTILQPSYEMGTQATEMLTKVITAQHRPLESDGSKPRSSEGAAAAA